MTRDEVFKAIDIADMAALKDILDKNPELAACHSNDGMSAVLFSLYINQSEITNLILSYEPALDIFDLAALGGTAQISALIAGNSKIIHEYNGVGFTALHIASYFGHADIVTLILENDGDIDKLTMDGSDLTALQSAISNLKYDVVDVLLKFKPNINVKMLGGFTPLMTAAAMGSKELVLKLIEHDADKALVSDDGRDAKAFAEAAGHQDIVTILN